MSQWRALAVLAAFWAGAAQADQKQYDIRVDGLVCPFCVAASEEALKEIEGVYSVASDLGTGMISICAENGTDLGETRMTDLFLSHGFTYRSQTVSAVCTIGTPRSDLGAQVDTQFADSGDAPSGHATQTF